MRWSQTGVSGAAEAQRKDGIRDSPYRKPHTLPWLGLRSEEIRVLRAFCEGWDTTNLDTDRRVSHPFAKNAKDGAPAFSWCFLPCRTLTAA
jgi:hypothetical protein